MDWLKVEDLNTSYIHSRANQRNRRNFISKLVLDSGEILEKEQRIGEAFVDYFRNLFQTANTSSLDLILQGMELKVSNQMNAALIQPFTVEVEQALKQMKPMTAPGPDSMPPLFYKSY